MLRSHQSRKSKSASHGFTLIELLVVISIISLLVSILLPSLQKARDLAKNVLCLSNMRNMGTGFQMYSAESEGHLLPSAFGTDQMMSWPVTIAPYINAPEIKDNEDRVNLILSKSLLTCPTAAEMLGRDRSTYGMSAYVSRFTGAPPACGKFLWNGSSGGTYDIVSSTYACMYKINDVLMPSKGMVFSEGRHNPGGWAELLLIGGSVSNFPEGVHKNREVTNNVFLDGHAAPIDNVDIPLSGYYGQVMYWRARHTFP